MPPAERKPTIRSTKTPPQLAAELGVTPDKVLGWIRSGELVAINIATSLSGRPRYVIEATAIADFKARRATGAPPPKPRRQRRTADVTPYYTW